MSLIVWLPLNNNLNNQGISNASFSGSVSYTAGKVTTNCASFNGSSNYVDTNITLTKTMTFMCWIKFNGTGNYHIIDCRAQSGESGYQPMYGGTNYGLQFYSSSSGSSGQWTAAECGFNTTNWFHIAVICTQNSSTLYINGTKISTKTISNFGADFGTRLMRLGTRVTGANWFNGLLNDVRVYDSCLTDTEIKDIANGLVLHYPLNNIINANLLTNPDTTYWMNSGTDYSANVTMTQKTEDGYAVTRIQRKATGGPCYYYGWYSSRLSSFPYANSTKYTVSAEIKSNHDGWFYFDSRNSATNSGSCSFTNTNGQWKRFSATWTTPASASSDTSALSLLGLNNDASATTSDYAEIRKCKIEKSDAASAYGNDTTAVYDVSGYSNSGIINSTTAPISASGSARYNNCCLFDGVNHSIKVPFNSVIKDTMFSINFWFYKSEWGSKGYETLFGGPSGFEIESKSSSTNVPKLVAYNWGGGSCDYTLNEWHMVTMTRTTSETKFYLDGVLKITGSAGTIPTGDYFIAAWNSASQQNFKGKMSDFRIYSTVLSQNMITDLYNAPIKITKSGTLVTNGEVIE